VLYAEFAEGHLPIVSVWLGFVRDREWVGLGGGSGEKRLLARRPRRGDGLYIIPFGSGSNASDEIDPSRHWLSVHYLQLHATSEVARVIVGDGNKERGFLPSSHGNMVVLWRVVHEDPDFPVLTADRTALREWMQRKKSTRAAFPDLKAFDSAGRELMHGIDRQPGFDEWVERRRRGDESCRG